MAGNTFGHIFRLTTFGESHGKAIGGIIDGCPAGLEIDHEFIQHELDRRRPGQSILTSPRQEEDKIEFLSGIFDGKSTGMPVAFIIWNKDQKSEDYDQLKELYRPSHADFTYDQKYGFRDYRGGGRSSARETACRVVGGAIAKLLLNRKKIEIKAFVSQIGNVKLDKEYIAIDLSKTETSPVRCPDAETGLKMEKLLEELKEKGDTTGGIIQGIISGVPAGTGEPVFDKLHAELGKAMLSINAVHGFEYGSGFAGSAMRGSTHNDTFIKSQDKISTVTNFSGGIQGGISNGQDICFRVAFKPIATLMSEQQTVDHKGNTKTLTGKGRHDVCVVPRAVPIVEAMAALVIADYLLLTKVSRLSNQSSDDLKS
jgi:chorismate synthase